MLFWFLVGTAGRHRAFQMAQYRRPCAFGNDSFIDQRDMPYIFDRFYRADASRNSATGGSGIGLSIVKKIIEDHGGKIWATSKEGDGTTMFFVIRKYQETQDMNRQ